jgi:glucose/arabinose dehydrogenase
MRLSANASARITLGALAGVLAAGLAVAACTDLDSPVIPPVAPADGPALAEFRCEANVAAQTVRCNAPAAVRSNLIIGGQGIYVQLRSSGIDIDTAGAELLFRFDVTLENLLRQPLGTADTAGFAPDAGGVKIFFTSEPAVTAGTGTVGLENEDGTGTFTAAAQDFFQYMLARRGGVDGPLPLARNDTTAPRNWVFRMDSTVQSFSFAVLVNSHVAFGAGWTDVAADSLWRRAREDTVVLPRGETRALDGRVRDRLGGVVGETITYASTDAAVAGVSAAGVVNAVAPGEALISGSAPGRPSYRRTRVIVHERLQLQLVAQGLSTPLYVTAPAGDPRLFVLEKPGRIRVVEGGVLLPTPFLDLTDRVSNNGERGLLSVAFHPAFATNRWLFVVYTDLDGDVRVERYTANAAATAADPASAHTILVVEHSQNHNHNGGLAMFGPGGRLFVSVGDGGNSANAQNRGVLLGKLLRLDVDGGDPYAIPADNPFVGQPGMRGEIWAYGLRNPWRYAIDQGTLYLADVGAALWEEVNAVPIATGGINFGWNVMEGAHCRVDPACDTSGKQLPVLEYSHDEGCSVTGGFVYRGAAMPSLQGRYFYADFCEGWVRSFRLQGGQVVDHRTHALGEGLRITSFGTDAAQELYITVVEGRVYRLVPGT